MPCWLKLIGRPLVYKKKLDSIPVLHSNTQHNRFSFSKREHSIELTADLKAPILFIYNDNNWPFVSCSTIPILQLNTIVKHWAKHELTKRDLTKRELTKRDLSKRELTKPELTKRDLTKRDLTKRELTKHELTKRVLTKRDLTKRCLTKRDLTKRELT